jgi:hypothetical protein
MDGTILQQGYFSASYSGANPNPGNATNQAGDYNIIQIPANADWVKVYNYTKYGANGLNSVYFQGTANSYAGVEYIWQRGMAAGTGIVKYKTNAASGMNADTLVSGGFTLYDPSGQSAGALPLVGNPVATTASTNATRPVVSTASTAGLSVGSVVRLSNTAQTDVNGIDMVVGAVTANTNFTLLFAGNALATAPGAIGGAGFYRIVNVDPLFYPRNRYVTNITRATNAQVSTSVYHGLTVGQRVRFSIPAVSGMIQLNPVPENNYLSAYVASVVDDYNFTINVNTLAFTAFTWPTIAQQPSSFPQVIPFGEDTASALVAVNDLLPVMPNGDQIFGTQSGILADATTNTGFLGMILGSGGNGTALTTPISGPAGTVHFTSADAIDAQDLMYWVAGKSSFGGL